MPNEYHQLMQQEVKLCTCRPQDADQKMTSGIRYPSFLIDYSKDNLEFLEIVFAFTGYIVDTLKSIHSSDLE